MNKETETIVQMWAEIQRLNEQLKGQKQFYDALCKPTEPVSCILTKEERAEIESYDIKSMHTLDGEKIYPINEERPDPKPFVFADWLKSKGFDYRNGVLGRLSDLKDRGFYIESSFIVNYSSKADFINHLKINIPRTISEAETLFYFLGINQ